MLCEQLQQLRLQSGLVDLDIVCEVNNMSRKSTETMYSSCILIDKGLQKVVWGLIGFLIESQARSSTT